MVTIELARLEDVARITEIANRAAEVGTANFATQAESVADWQASYRTSCDQYPWLVARDRSGAVVGFAKAGVHKARGAYRWTAEMTVYLDDDWQGKKLGSALYERLIPVLDAQGFMTLLAGITTGHAASERLHARFGFTRCATFHRAGWKLGGWHDVSYWERQLRSDPGEPPALRPVRDVWK
jgi:phosphinothricin acetyltransferase